MICHVTISGNIINVQSPPSFVSSTLPLLRTLTGGLEPCPVCGFCFFSDVSRSLFSQYPTNEPTPTLTLRVLTTIHSKRPPRINLSHILPSRCYPRYATLLVHLGFSCKTSPVLANLTLSFQAQLKLFPLLRPLVLCMI